MTEPLDNSLELPPDPDAGLFGVDLDLEKDEIVIVGVPWEPTASYGRGTSRTPEAIVPVSHQLDFFDPFLNGAFADAVGMLPLDPDWVAQNQGCIDAVDLVIRGGTATAREIARHLEAVNQASRGLNLALRQKVEPLLEKGKVVGILGGDHSAPLGSMLAHAARYPGMGVLHFDAHHDLREAYEGFTYSHASIMFNLLREAPELGCLVSVGIRDYAESEHRYAQGHDKIRTFYDRDLKRAQYGGTGWERCCAEIIEALPREVYVSLDIDGLDPSLCPNTGTPVPGGLDFCQTCFLLERLIESGRRIVGFDLCEVAPNPARSCDDWDLNVAARLLHKLCVCSHMSRR